MIYARGYVCRMCPSTEAAVYESHDAIRFVCEGCGETWALSIERHSDKGRVAKVPCMARTKSGHPCPLEGEHTEADGSRRCHVHYSQGKFQQQVRARRSQRRARRR